MDASPTSDRDEATPVWSAEHISLELFPLDLVLFLFQGAGKALLLMEVTFGTSVVSARLSPLFLVEGDHLQHGEVVVEHLS